MVDHQVPVDGQHPARAHHQPAHHGDLPRPRHRGRRTGPGHAARPDGRHGVLHQPGRRRDRPGPHLGHPPGARGRLHAGQPVAATATSRRPSWSRSSSGTPPPGAAGSGSTPSTSASRRTTTGVTVTVRDRVTGQRVRHPGQVRDRRRRRPQPVAADVGLPFEGQMDLAGSMNIVFHADLSHLVEHRPSVLYWVLQPGADVGGIGLGLVRMVRPWNEWLIVWGYDINQPPPDVDDEMATRIVHELVGDDTDPGDDPLDLAVGQQQDVRHPLPRRAGCSAWATPCTGTRRRTGWAPTPRSRTPTTWPGSSPTCCAAPRGRRCSTPTTPSAPRSASRSCCAPTRASRSSARSSTRSALTRHRRPRDACAGTSRPAGDNTPEAARQRAELRKALELKDYEFNAHGVELGQRYASGAVVPDGTAGAGVHPRPASCTTTRRPGRAPGCRTSGWAATGTGSPPTTSPARAGSACSPASPGEAWAEAAAKVAEELGIEVAAHVIGPGREHIDLYEDWARAREVGEDGCVLVRPDAHVAWRSAGLRRRPGAPSCVEFSPPSWPATDTGGTRRWDGWTAKSPSSPERPAARAARMRSGWRVRARTSSRPTSPGRSRRSAMRLQPRRTWPRPSKEVEALDRRIVSFAADVRDHDALKSGLDAARRRARRPRRPRRECGDHQCGSARAGSCPRPTGRR